MSQFLALFKTSYTPGELKTERELVSTENDELYQGRGQIIIKPTGTLGKIGITLSGNQIPDSKAMVLVE